MSRMTLLAIGWLLAFTPTMMAQPRSLAPGKPAGVKAAQDSSQLATIGVAALIAVGVLGIVLATGPKLNTGNNSATSTTP